MINSKSIMTIDFFQKIHNELQKTVSQYNRYRQHRIWMKLRRNRYRFLLSFFIILFVLYASGIIFYPFELDFDTSFEYPLYINNFPHFIEIVKKDLNNNALRPINNYSYHYHLNPKDKCSHDASSHNKNSFYPIRLLLVIKSATCNFLLRNVIRQTWGDEHRFSDVTIRRVFMLGRCSSDKTSICENTFHKYSKIIFFPKSNSFSSMFAHNKTVQCQQMIEMEHQFYGDLVQADFLDSYYNNTKKTMASLQWTIQYCLHVPFIFFVDDDYYVSIKNLLKFSRNYLQIAQREILKKSYQDHENLGEDDKIEDLQLLNLVRVDIYNKKLFDGRLYAGFVFNHARPQRHITSKWYVNLNEYPYNRYPPYVTGGSFIINNRTLIDLYYASFFTKPFKYDDIYLGILANKMKINLLANNKLMHFYKLPYDSTAYAKVLSSHGYHDPEELWQVWQEQKSLGNV